MIAVEPRRDGVMASNKHDEVLSKLLCSFIQTNAQNTVVSIKLESQIT